jgi:hypothetical protein
VPEWEWLAEAFGGFVLLLGCYGLALVARRRLIARNGGTFELSYRARSTKTGRGWVLGIGRYSGDSLEWFRIFSLGVRPRRVWRRSVLTYDGRRDPVGGESLSLFADHVIVCCSTPSGRVEIAMSPGSLTGFQSWLEAAPPGTDWDRPRRV